MLGYAAYQLNLSIDRTGDALRHQAELRFLGELLAKGSDYLTAEVRSYVQFGNKLHYDNFWREVNKTRSRDRVVEKLKSLKVFPENLKYIEIAKEYSDNLIKTEKEAMKEVEAGNFRAARELVFGEYYVDQKKLIMGNIKNFQNAINKIAFDQTREAESNAELFIDLTNFLLILSGLVVLLFFYFIGIKELVQPMKILTSLMLKIAQGNLEEKIPHVLQIQNNEIGAMASTLEFFKGRLIKQNQEEESVQNERQRFLNMLDQLPVSFHLQANDHTVPFANQMFRNRFGDPETKKCYQLMHKRKIPCEPCPTFKSFDSGKTESSIWTSKDDKAYLSVVTPFDDLNGENLLMEMSIDITNEQNYRKSQVQSEKRFRTIFDESPLGIALIDSLTGHIYEVNHKFAKIAGRSLNQMATIDWMSITHPDDIQEDLDNMKSMNTGKTTGFNMDKRYIKPDGSYTWINLTVTPMTVEDKNKPCHLAMIKEIDERKINETFIQFQSEILQIVAQEVPLNDILEEIVLGVEKISTGIIASILLLDKPGKNLWHGAAPNLPKPYREEIDGVPIGPSCGSCGTAAYRKETVIVGDIASDPLWAHGKKIALSYGLKSCWSVPIFDMTNNLLGTLAFYSKEPKMPSKWDYAIMKIANVAGIAIERSYSKKALNEYQNKLTALLIEKTKEVEGGEQKFQSYFDLPLVGFAITSPEKGWLDVNQYLCNMLGYSLEELKQMTWLNITHPEDFEAETFQFSRMLAGEIETYSLEQRFIRKNRTTIHTLLSVACVRSENAKVKTVFAVMQDISARKLAEQQLQESQSLVIHSDKLLSLGKLVGSVAHEFNNPLFGLINLVDQLGETLNTDERKKYSEIAQKECWRMADMIKNLQSFYKPSEGIFIPTEMDELIEGVLLIVTKACKIKGIQINANYNTNIFTFESIEDQIKQVILNVLQNSIDSVSVDGGKITLTLNRTNSNLILKIQDTGEGIKKEDLKLIFDPFFTTKGKEGTGLGLSVSYGIVKNHGGEIIIESVLGVGSAVTLTLPIAREIC